MAKKCLNEACTNEAVGRKKYCCPDCKVAQRNLRENGPKVEEVIDRYEDVEPDLSLLDEGAWMLYPKSHTDKRCIGDFIRVWKRPPAHVLFSPAQYPLWKFAGPVHNSEELARRWQGAETD